MVRIYRVNKSVLLNLTDQHFLCQRFPAIVSQLPDIPPFHQLNLFLGHPRLQTPGLALYLLTGHIEYLGWKAPVSPV